MLDLFLGKDWRNRVIVTGRMKLEGISDNGKTHNYLPLHSIVTITYNKNTDEISLFLRDIIIGCLEPNIPIESVMVPSPLKNSRRRLSSWLPIEIVVTDDIIEQGSENIQWVIQTIAQATSIIQLSHALDNATSSDYKILYALFELGPKPDRSSELESNFTNLMCLKRFL